MPVAVSYPGVYIQEIPSGVHTITGVSTSLTAFVGRTYRGPVNTPISISSFADFQRFWLSFDFPLSYAVRDFFQNGGSEGVVVRLYGTPSVTHHDLASASGTAAGTIATGDSTGGGTTVNGQPADTTGTHATTDTNDKIDAAAQSPAPQTTATIAVTGQAGFEAIGAANTVLNAAGAAAGAQGDATQVAAAATAAARQFRNASSAAQAAAKQTAALATGQEASGAAALADIANGVAGVLTQSDTAAIIPNLTSTLTTAITNAQGAVAAGWVKAVAVTSGSSQATLGSVSDVNTAVTGSGDAAKAVSAVATKAAGVAHATGVDVATAAAAAAQGAVASTSTPSLTLSASSPGNWPNGAVTVTADTNGITLQVAQGINPAFTVSDLFNLSVVYVAPDGTSQNERFINVSLNADAGPVRLDRVLNGGSNFLAYTYPTSGTAPTPPLSGATGTATGGSASAYLQDIDYLGNAAAKTGMYALDNYEIFNIMVIPPDKRLSEMPQYPAADVYQAAAEYCAQRRAFLIIDPPNFISPTWSAMWQQGEASNISLTQALGTYGPEGRNAAVYFPNVVELDPLLGSQPQLFAPSGAIAGIYARTDATRGVWKAPAGVNDGAISGVQSLELKMTDADNGELNPIGLNCLRTFPVFGSVVWGARTLKGADQLSDDYKYIPVRRLALYVEQSLYQSTQWAVFEPNAEPLWASLRLAIGSFMNQLFRQGAFAGSSAKDAYFVACDGTTTTQADIDAGVVNVTVGFAPLKPAEFVVISIQQIAGQLAT
jgi:phage tail sheath protein FI